ncbi:hypothetical protein Nepgr_017070 [Nepenthes gracilis]|uniref:Uncharacterized protein n=1 Tax=Nepenthes gracilis TaxID=150966 RepID=A0AAD3SQW6_NEPGR|nr:hypothetical protein Nepgr_017070 [Nepenthes gracilis]
MQEFRVEETTSAVAFLSVCLLLQLPFERIDGNPTPTVIFKGRPSHFHAFVLLLSCTFTSGLITICLRQMYSTFGRCCRHIALLSLITAVAIFLGLVMVDLLPLLSLSAIVT